jgi:hypothetical protein
MQRTTRDVPVHVDPVNEQTRESVERQRRILAGWRLRHVWPLIPAIAFVLVAVGLWLGAVHNLHEARQASATKQAAARAYVQKLNRRLVATRKRAATTRRAIRRAARLLAADRRWYATHRVSYTTSERLKGDRSGASSGRTAALTDVNSKLKRDGWYFVRLKSGASEPSIVRALELTGDPQTSYWKVP